MNQTLSFNDYEANQVNILLMEISSQDNSFEEQEVEVEVEEDQAALGAKRSQQFLGQPKVRVLFVGAIIIAIVIGVIVSEKIFTEIQAFDLTSFKLSVKEQRNLSLSYKEAINASTQLIDRIQKSITQYECLNLKPLFHSHDYVKRVMYFSTYDEIIMPGCLNLYNYKWSVSRENIGRWNRDREATEWAFQHVKEGDKVLYYRPEVYNLAEATILSKLVGPKGRLTILKGEKSQECLSAILKLHSLKDNIYYQEDPSGKYDIFIGNDTLFKQQLKGHIADHAKMLVYTADVDALRRDFGRYKIEPFRLEDKECGKGMYGGPVDMQSALFSFTAVGQLIPERRVFKRSGFAAEKKILEALERQYLVYKLQYVKVEAGEIERLKILDDSQLCRSPNSQREGDGFVVTTYGHKLHGVSLKQVEEWEGRLEAVEWLRPKAPSLSTVYYEVGRSFNLLVIVEVAHLVRDGTLYVVCSEEECERIAEQANKSRLDNVARLGESSAKQALLAGAVITDNETLVKELLASDYDKEHALLGHFTHSRNESLVAMRQIYVHHNLREIFIPQSANKHCAGFQFLHFFWNHSHPHSYYDITPSKYVVYSFWGGRPEETPERKSLMMRNEVASQGVQYKILSQQLFLFFETKENPIHPAFYLLSPIHKSDYVRIYMMHTYGGGHADLKHYHFNWKPFFQRMEQDNIRMAYGYAQKAYDDVGCHDEEGLFPKCKVIQSEYKRLIGNSCYIFKKNSSLTRDWYNASITTLDNKLEALRKNPPKVPRQFNGGTFKLEDGTKFISNYPFRWAQITGQHLGRFLYKYIDYLATDMPYIINVDYRIASISDII